MLVSLKSHLSQKSILFLRVLKQNIHSFFYGFNLQKLALIYGTDKGKGHDFMPIYQHFLRNYKFKNILLLEIGIGGYEDEYRGGNSLRMWARYFIFGKIVGIDIHNKKIHENRKIRTFKTSQSDEKALNALISKIGSPNIIIDDGSHFCKDVILSFKVLFSKLKQDGLYIIEDTQTSYWEVCGGSLDKDNSSTTMNFFKQLTDGLNYSEFPIAEYEASYFEKNITSIHFYHNLIFVQKGRNNKGSNVLKNNIFPTIS